MQEPPRCPICSGPKRTEFGGSLTQWIVSCACDLQLQSQQQLSINICTRCFKRIGQGKAGTFSQFIFRSDLCSCDRSIPESEHDVISEASPSSDHLDEELEVTCRFPLERYSPIRFLGGGSTGNVYLSRDRLLNKIVAVKILHELTENQIVAFQVEAKILGRLKHANVVEILDFGMEGDAPYMVLEFVRGTTLRNALDKLGRMDLQTSSHIMQQVCLALQYANDRGIFHYDIQPANILLVEDESGFSTVKLIDFGMIALASKRIEGCPDDVQVCGVPAYMSPDVGKGLEYDARCQTYSLGCVLFEMICGQPPFAGGTPLHTLYLHANIEPPKLSEAGLGKDSSLQLEFLLHTALLKDPSARFQSAREFSSALQEVVSSEHNQVNSPRPNPTSRFESWLLLTLVALVFITAGGFLVDLSSGSDGDSKSRSSEPRRPPKRESTFSKQIKVFEDDSVFYRKKGGVVSGLFETDETMRFLAKFHDIEVLEIQKDSRISGKGFSYLRGNKLRSVTIESPEFDDRGAAELAAFPALEKLHFVGLSKLTERGLLDIGKNSRVKLIQFDENEAARLSKGLSHLRKTRPDITIVD